jgi:hypothetical protein
MSVGGAPSAGEFDLSNPLSSFVDVVRRVTLHPITFFAEIPRRGGFLSPLLFAIICGEISAILGGLLSLLLGVGGTQGFQSFLNPIGVYTDYLGFIGTLIAVPFVVAISLFIYAGIFHLLVRLIVGAGNSGYEATFRVPSYATVVSLVSWIPIIGLLASLYSLYLQIVGLREIHETTTGKAIWVFVAYIVVVIVLGGIIGAVVGVFVFSRGMGSEIGG